MDEYLATSPSRPPPAGRDARRRHRRRSSGSGWRRWCCRWCAARWDGPTGSILHFDDGDDVLATLAAERHRRAGRRGMATPEHLLRAGRLPVWLDLDLAAPEDRLAGQVRSQLAAARAEYEEYHGRHAGGRRAPARRLGQGRAGSRARHDHRLQRQASAVTANLCYRAVLETIENAEAVDRFEFIAGAGRLRVRALAAGAPEGGGADRQGARHQAAAPARGGGDRRRAAGSAGAAALRFAEEGAHVVVADLDGAAAEGVAAEVAAQLSRPRGRRRGGRAGRREPRRPLPPRRCSSSAGSTRLFYTAGAAAALRARSPRSGGRTCSASSRSTTSGRWPRSAGRRR